MTKLKRFIAKFKWWMKWSHQCRGFCPTCRHYNICRHDQETWED